MATRATLAAAAAANGMNYGDWTAPEDHACVKALIVHGAAFFEDDIVWTVAWKRCAWLKMKDAIGTREISQIQAHVTYWFQVGERICTATSPAERRAIHAERLAAAVVALEADDASRLERVQVVSEEVDDAAAASAVEAYQEAAKSVVDAAPAEKAALRVQRDALEEAAVKAYPDLFPVVEARRPVSKFSSHVAFD